MSKKMILLFMGFLLCIGICLSPALTDVPPPDIEQPSPVEGLEEASENSTAPAPGPSSEPLQQDELLETLQNIHPHPNGIINPVLLGEYEAPEMNLSEAILMDTGIGFTAISDTAPPNHELQIYLPEQTAFAGSHVQLTADRISDRQYLSGKAESVYSFRYGTFSFRIPVMRGSGLFPAIWMLPENGSSYPELDIYEMVGNHPDKLYGVIHFTDPESSQKNRDFFKHSLEGKVPESYVLDFEWAADHMVWYLDGTELYRITHDVPDIPMYMIINLAVGGDWPGDPGNDTEFPACFDVELLKFQPEEIFVR